jgi:hypothetical protein
MYVITPHPFLRRTNAEAWTSIFPPLSITQQKFFGPGQRPLLNLLYFAKEPNLMINRDLIWAVWKQPDRLKREK